MKRLLLLVILIIIAFLCINYYHGVSYKQCNKCQSNKIHMLDINFPSDKDVSCLYKSLKIHGSVLDPELNFNNAKGKKLDSVELEKLCPDIIDWFLTPELLLDASSVLGENVNFADNSEKYRIFCRLYDDDKDFLNWHYDNNFTQGNRFTLVIPLLVDDCNTAEFEYKDRKTGEEHIVPIQLGQGVLYNGSEVYHRITQQKQNCKRMVVIIPLYTDYKKSLYGSIRQFIRNITYKNLIFLGTT